MSDDTSGPRASFDESDYFDSKRHSLPKPDESILTAIRHNNPQAELLSSPGTSRSLANSTFDGRPHDPSDPQRLSELEKKYDDLLHKYETIKAQNRRLQLQLKKRDIGGEMTTK